MSFLHDDMIGSFHGQIYVMIVDTTSNMKKDLHCDDTSSMKKDWLCVAAASSMEKDWLCDDTSSMKKD